VGFAGNLSKNLRADLLQKAARTFFAYEYLMTVLPGEASHYSYEEFNQLARVCVWDMRNHNLLRGTEIRVSTKFPRMQ